MLKRFLKSIYVIAGIIVFLILFFVFALGIHVKVGEAVLYSAVLAVVGIVALWWKQEVW